MFLVGKPTKNGERVKGVLALGCHNKRNKYNKENGKGKSRNKKGKDDQDSNPAEVEWPGAAHIQNPAEEKQESFSRSKRRGEEGTEREGEMTRQKIPAKAQSGKGGKREKEGLRNREGNGTDQKRSLTRLAPLNLSPKGLELDPTILQKRCGIVI